MSAPGRYDALLFDLDGTLIDSMPLHHAAWARWFAQQGLPFEEEGFFEATAGRTNDEILRDLYPASDAAHRAAMAEQKEALYREAARRSLQLVPGAAQVMERAHAAGLKLAICTAAPKGNIAVAFERFGLDRLVAAVTSPEDGLRGKPHPDIFEEAARRLGVPAARCLVFEDAPLGIEAARRAGMDAVALATTLPAAAFAPYPNLRHVMADFVGFDPDTLTPEEKTHA